MRASTIYRGVLGPCPLLHLHPRTLAYARKRVVTPHAATVMEVRGGAVVAVLRLLVASELYERLISPVRRTGRASYTPLESWWWLAYVLASPLLFLPAAGPLPIIGLFCTRFVIECLQERSRDWLFAGRSRGSPRVAARPAPHYALVPLLSD